MIKNINWNIYDYSDEKLQLFFKNNRNLFKNMAGDIETFVFYTKICHAKRIIVNPKLKKNINLQDIDNALIEFKNNKGISNEDDNELWKNLYN